jgi:LEA14-like dessication related protein
MRKKIYCLIVILIIFIYIILTAILFFSVQTIIAPEVIIKVEISELNTEEAILLTSIQVENLNGFDIILRNLKIESTTIDGYKVASISIKGGKIAANKNRTFNNQNVIAFNGHSPDVLKTKITGEVGANILFLQKTIDLKVGVITSLDEVLNNIEIPSASIFVEFDELIEGGIKLSALINITNPNSFDLIFDDISADFITDSGEVVGNIDLFGGKIKANDSLSVKGNGNILFESLNAETLTIELESDFTVIIAGFEKSLPFNIETNIVVPNLEELLLATGDPTFLSIKLDERFTLRGIMFYVTLQITNNYKFDIEIRNLEFGIYSVRNNNPRLLGQNKKIEQIKVDAGAKDQSTCQILIPYRKILPIYFTSKWIMGSVVGRVSIKGVNHSVYLQIRGYQSLRPVR